MFLAVGIPRIASPVRIRRLSVDRLAWFIISNSALYSWSDKNMIRFLQESGKATKYVLGGLLLIICASMVITLIPGGLGGDVFGGAPGRGIVAKVDGGDITTDDVRQTARQMLQQQMPQGGANMSMLLPFFSQRAAEQLITREALISQAEHMGLRTSPEEIK